MSSSGAESFLIQSVGWLRLVIEATGAFLVGLGFLVAAIRLVQEYVSKRTAEFTRVRLVLARYLALALEFQLGADILSTAIAPSWQEIGKLAAIAVIRTGLNYFLSREMREEGQVVQAESRAVRADRAAS